MSGDMRRLRRPLWWLERSEFFGWCAPMERQGEAFVVVPGFPVLNGGRGCLEVRETLSAPELLLVDPVAAFHLAVLFRTPRADVAMPDPAALYREAKANGNSAP